MKQISKIILCSSLSLLYCSCGISSSSQNDNPQRPNVLFICIDDLRPELSCYGQSEIKSPYIDQFAKESVMFTNHFVSVPTCGANRYSLFSGLRPTRPVHLGNDAIPRVISYDKKHLHAESFAEYFKQKGYYTLSIGKVTNSPDGHDYPYNGETGPAELPHSWNEILFDKGEWNSGWDAFFGYAHGKSREEQKKQVLPYECADVPDTGYPDGLTAQLAIKKLKEVKNRKQPFLMAVGFFKPHLPFCSPKKYWDLYNEDSLSISSTPNMPLNVSPKSLHNSGEFNAGYQLSPEKPSLKNRVSDSYARKLRHGYFAAVSYTDAQVGKVLQALKDEGLDKNTIVVLWGDHGWQLGDHCVWGKHTLFSQSLRSAFIVKAPNVSHAGVAHGIVETIDIYPTLLELCGLGNPSYPIDGQSFVPLLKKPNSQGKKAAYSYFNRGITMFNGEYRLTKYFRKDKPTIELYDETIDPLESKNVAEDNPKKVQQLMPLWSKGDNGIYSH